MVEVKVVKKTMVLQEVEENEQQSDHLERKKVSEQQAQDANTANLSRQQLFDMMQVIEEIRMNGYKERL
ncbi:hypothetical protein D0439_12405 [Lysinibacillus fusiformis]|uniref:hypothetical protein n=1 Tax=Lysinibacillus fusiformis TaxID=28031 RepID=UPI000690168C|nr:hypothetical protein D0439_12405 [Lysinibacillus fusiformis]